eukprot:TRINITY_DN89_c0_g2_i1.p1 TRINITY_DN89_c0_g2~~TRINITY_DN89_c0_g2_i1.p1  ORF type:complete len:1136 (+),score=272.42 TRINITY_DN89_c0_g2_i1:100-3408(+)
MACRGRRVGLPTVLVLLTLLLVLCASCITAGLLSAAAGTALSESNRTAYRAVEACFSVGMSAAEEIADEVLVSSLARARVRITAFLSPALGAYSGLRNFILATPFERVDDPYFRNHTVRAVQLGLWLTARGESNNAVLSFNFMKLHWEPGHAQLIIFEEETRTLHRAPDDFHMLLVRESDVVPFTDVRMGSFNATGHIIPGGVCDFSRHLSTAGRQPTGVCRSVSSTAAGGAVVADYVWHRLGETWAPVQTLTWPGMRPTTAMKFIGSFEHPGQPFLPLVGRKVAVVYAQIAVDSVSGYLSRLAAQTQTRVRVYVTQTDIFANRSGLLIGVSHPSTSEDEEGTTGELAAREPQGQLLHARDYVIRAHAHRALNITVGADVASLWGSHEMVREFHDCGNPAPELIELPATTSVSVCADQVADSPFCSLEFSAVQPRFGSALVECVCVAHGSTCQVRSREDTVWRLRRPSGREVLHAHTPCWTGAGSTLLLGSTGGPDACEARTRGNSLCSDVYYITTITGDSVCFCVRTGFTCSLVGTYAEHNATNPAVYRLIGPPKAPPPSGRPEDTYGRLEDKTEAINITNASADNSVREPELWWARVLRVADESRNLLLHVSALVPVEDILIEAYIAMEKVNGDIEADARRLVDKQNRDFAVRYVIIACAALILLLAAAALPRIVVAPLSSLEGDMALVAQMRLELVEVREPSALSEVRQMQESFRQMLSCIETYKTYLPQSTLLHVGDEGTGSDDSDCFRAPREEAWGPSCGSSDTADVRKVSGSTPVQRTSGQSSGADAGGGSSDGATKPAALRDRRRSTWNFGSRADLMAAIVLQPKQCPATLLLANQLGFLKAAARMTADEIHADIAQAVESFTAHVQKAKGVVDLISADHLSASFGAARACAAQHAAAVHAAALIGGERAAGAEGRERPTSSCAVCSAKVLCGDFGSSEQRRYMIIGGVSCFVRIVERLAARCGVPLLVDKAVSADAAPAWCLRARFLVVYAKRGSPRPASLWEPIGSAQRRAEGDAWMYGAQEEHGWEAYNKAQTLWWQGAGEEALQAAEHAERAAEAPEQKEAAAALAADIRAGRTAVLEAADVQMTPAECAD